MSKFESAQPGTHVYNAQLGKGIVQEVRPDRLVVRHERGGAYYDLDGKGVTGQLHFFSKPAG